MNITARQWKNDTKPASSEVWVFGKDKDGEAKQVLGILRGKRAHRAAAVVLGKSILSKRWEPVGVRQDVDAAWNAALNWSNRWHDEFMVVAIGSTVNA